VTLDSKDITLWLYNAVTCKHRYFLPLTDTLLTISEITFALKLFPKVLTGFYSFISTEIKVTSTAVFP